MTKKLLLSIAFILFSFVAFAQQIILRGHIADANSSEPVIAASIGIKDQAAGTIANEEGDFQLTADKTDVILISCIGYKTLAVGASEFASETKKIVLQPDEIALEEIIMSKKPIYEILEEVIETSRGRFNKPIVLNTYYREFVKMNGKYTKFSDALVDYHITGTTKKTKSDVIVKQNRAVRVFKDDDEAFEASSLFNVQNGTDSDYEFKFFSHMLFKSRNYEEYDFRLKSKKNANGKEMLTILFEPKADSDEAVYKGSVTYDPDTKLVYDLEVSGVPSKAGNIKQINILLFRIAIQDVKLHVMYKMTGNNYLLSYNSRYAKVKIWNKKTYNDVIESKCDLIVTNFSTESGYDKKTVYKGKNLYKLGSTYTEKFWQQNNSIVLTDEEQAIIRSLEKESGGTRVQ
jgi:hypothetical protein